MSYLIDRQAAIMGLIFSDCTRDLTCGQMAKILYVIQALPSAQPEIIHCVECEHNNDCNIQYVAQGGELFYCGAAERREE